MSSVTPIFYGGGLVGLGMENEKPGSFERQQMLEPQAAVGPPSPQTSVASLHNSDLAHTSLAGGAEERGGFLGLSLSLWKWGPQLVQGCSLLSDLFSQSGAQRQRQVGKAWWDLGQLF